MAHRPPSREKALSREQRLRRGWRQLQARMMATVMVQCRRPVRLSGESADLVSGGYALLRRVGIILAAFVFTPRLDGLRVIIDQT